MPILAAIPQLCVVDEFPHTNVPGSERTKRWEDVQVLLDAGIDVLTTMNIQHLESLNDQVWQITGVRVRETIPDWVMQQADQVVMVDLTPRALLNRLARGVVYTPGESSGGAGKFFSRIHAGGACASWLFARPRTKWRSGRWTTIHRDSRRTPPTAR